MPHQSNHKLYFVCSQFWATMISYDAWMGVNIDELIFTNLPLLQEPPTSNPLVETEYEELLCVLIETFVQWQNSLRIERYLLHLCTKKYIYTLYRKKYLHVAYMGHHSYYFLAKSCDSYEHKQIPWGSCSRTVSRHSEAQNRSVSFTEKRTPLFFPGH